MRYRKNVGDFGEDFAVKILIESGYSIIERNYSTKYGEIDIIAMKDGVLHFIEVKTRTVMEYGYPSEAVTEEKQRRIRRVAEGYLSRRRTRWRNVSFDVFEIMTNLITDCM